MIKYTIDQITERISNPVKSSLIQAARKYADKINMHVTGKGLDKHFEQIKNYENDDQLLLRKRYARSNKALFTTLLRPLDKVYSAKGFAKYYNVSEQSEKRFIEILSNIRDNLGLQKWCENVWKKKRITDPNGVILIEISKDGLNCYPTYKSIYNIFDFDNSGSLLDLIIFEPEIVINELGEEIKKVRVIDSYFDYMFKIESKEGKETISQIEEETFPNYFKRVPGRIVGNQFEENEGYATSFIHDSLELAAEILEDNSVKIIFKRTHGYQIYWEIERQCPVCKGLREVNGHKCSACDGDGIRHSKDVSDKLIVTLGEDGKTSSIPPAGYVSTDVSTWMQMNNEEDLMIRLINKTQWGTLALIQDQSYKTATGVISDTQPINDRLHPFSVEAEDVEKFITDLLGAFYFGLTYKGSTIIYGKRYQIESPDQMLIKLTDAKKNGAPEQIVMNLYIEYLQTQFGSDSFEMTKQMIIFSLAYYPIWNLSELKDLGLPDNEIRKKLLFWEWIESIPQNSLLFTRKEILEKQRDEYINLKLKENAYLQADSSTIGAIAS